MYRVQAASETLEEVDGLSVEEDGIVRLLDKGMVTGTALEVCSQCGWCQSI